jgi:rubrerythrin
MKKPTDTGSNRTGIKTSPVESKKTIEGAEAGTPAEMTSTDPFELHSMRAKYSTSAPAIGSMPPPGTLRQSARAVVKSLTGKHMNVFVDQLGARLAFERTGTRIYEALLVKLEAASVHDGGPTRDDLEHIRDEELAHAAMLIECFEEIGADATAVTPAADVQAVASCGIVQIVADPRTTLTQALEAVLTAELTDVESWQLLADMAGKLGHEDMASRFNRAFREEQEHLIKVRDWVTSSLLGQAGIEDEAEEEHAGSSDDGKELHPPPTGTGPRSAH